MLNVQRRHTLCKRDEWDAGYLKCGCPVIIRGTLRGNRVTKGLKRFLPAEHHTPEAARALAMLWEREGRVYQPTLQEILGTPIPGTAQTPDDSPIQKQILLRTAVSLYINSAENRGNAHNTLRKKKTVFETGHESLLVFAERGGYRFVSQIDALFLEEWRNSWSLEALARFKRQCQVIGFLWFCQRHGWFPPTYTDQMTAALGRIEVPKKQTGYFPPDEFKKIIDATYAYITPTDELSGEGTGGARLRALIQLMRWTGLALHDAVTLDRTRLRVDAGTNMMSVALRRGKTDEWVYCPIPPHVVALLQSVPAGPRSATSKYFFWTGRGKVNSVLGNWQRAFAALFTIADLRDVNGERKQTGSHMFRDTFAVESLLSGVRIETVRDLLGHSSVKTTEESYMPWVLARQDSLNIAVVASWAAQGIIEAPQPGNAVRLRIIARKKPA